MICDTWQWRVTSGLKLQPIRARIAPDFDVSEDTNTLTLTILMRCRNCHSRGSNATL